MAKITLKFPDSVPRKQINEKFLQGMLDRMAVGYFNYGPVEEDFPMKSDAIKSLRRRLSHYRKTHNLEFLMDVANYAMIEFMCPKDKKAFFSPTTKRESPGQVHVSGRVFKGKEEEL